MRRHCTAFWGCMVTKPCGRKKAQFLDADLLVVDESSMMDMSLAYQMFRRIRPNTRILLVGDADQLEKA